MKMPRTATHTGREYASLGLAQRAESQDAENGQHQDGDDPTSNKRYKVYSEEDENHESQQEPNPGILSALSKEAHQYHVDAGYHRRQELEAGVLTLGIAKDGVRLPELSLLE